MSKGTISFHSEQTSFSLRSRRLLRSWLAAVIKKEKGLTGDIAFIFTSDKHLLQINRDFLSHDYYTDVITFDYCHGPKMARVISGDIFISIDRVRDNARAVQIPFTDELHRVMVHGLLHLCGHADKTPKQEKAIRGLEDFYLSLPLRKKSST